MKRHTDKKIFPRASFYLEMVKKISREEALALMEEAVKIAVEPYRKKLQNATKLSFVRSLFFKIFNKAITTSFNEDAGFKYGKVEYDNKHYKFDILECPYLKYCEKLGCKELTQSFCFSDDCLYSTMTGIAFERTSTLGRGGNKCDFYFYEKNSL